MKIYFYNIIKRKIVFEKLFPKKCGPWEALCPHSCDQRIQGLTRCLHYIKINKVVNNLYKSITYPPNPNSSIIYLKGDL